MKYGYYTKHFNTNEDPILTYDANCDSRDNHFEAGKLCKTNGFQVIETSKDSKNFEFEYTDNGFIHDIQRYFNRLLYSFYNIYGQRVKSLLVQFDFDNSTITVNGRTLKVESDREYTYKILKIKVKAINGIEGLYKHILESMHVDSVFNCSTYSILCAIGNIKED